jgi:hypothetical protein
MDAPCAPQSDPCSPSVQPATSENSAVPVEGTNSTEPATSEESETDSETLDTEQEIEAISVIHATRTWVQYGIFGFAVLCIIIGAMEALFGR